MVLLQAALAFGLFLYGIALFLFLVVLPVLFVIIYRKLRKKQEQETQMRSTKHQTTVIVKAALYSILATALICIVIFFLAAIGMDWTDT